MARFVEKENLKNIRCLVKNITGFGVQDDNFSLCVQFALSNLQYHKFLDVDSHKVTRTLEGICDKFRIHSEDLKYRKFKELSEKFLASPVFEQKENGKTDTHYAILSFLVLVADTPLAGDYVETRQTIPDIRVDFNWGEYLLEGIETYQPSDGDSSDWTDEEDTLEENDIRVPSIVREQNQTGVISHDVSHQVAPYVVSDGSTNEWEEPTQIQGSDWLTRNLVAQYWRGEDLEIESGKYRTCQLNNDWEAYKANVNPLYGRKGTSITVTENILMREIVWMLSGVSSLYLLHYNGKYFVPKQKICVPHLSEEKLQDYLSDFTKYGSYIHVLQSFVATCYEVGETGMCQTYQSFATAVADFIQKLKAELALIEQKLIKQEEILTLLSLSKDLKPLMRKVGVVFLLYMKGVHQGRGFEYPSQRATLLLSTLYNTLMSCDTLFESPIMDENIDGVGDGFDSSEIMELLLPMWIQTCQPYINIIDTWISHGYLTDPCAEFIIHRNKDIHTLDETYWEKSFVFHTKKPERGRSECEDEGGTRQSDYDTTDWAPKFLQPVLQQVVLTGKSMEMLESLGKLAENDGKANIDIAEFKEGHLYDKFISSLQTLLGMKIGKTDEEFQRDNTPNDDGVFSPDIDRQMKEKGMLDNFLKTHFENLMKQEKQSHSILEQSFIDTMRDLDLNGLQPIELILQQCLYPHIHRQYERVCLKLVQVLKTEYKLIDYLGSMRKLFLMEAGDAMYIFYTEIFDKIRLKDHWKDTTSVTWALHEALENHFSEEVSRLAVLVETSDRPGDSQPINITNCLRLQYQIPCPVDVVINEKCQQAYNQIFSFLLQVKRAKYCLDELRFHDLAKESILSQSDELICSFNVEQVPRETKIHRMHLLRMRLINFVNSLHNYIMTRILHSVGLEFTRDLDTARDLDQIIEIHAGYIRKIHERCLLHRKNGFLKEAMLKVLNLGLRFQTEWDLGIDCISMEQIQDTESEFSRCLQFLSSFLNSVIQRGSFPHLESLAFGLENLTPS